MAVPATQALCWSVRRELWENRSIYIAPLTVAAVTPFAFAMSAIAGIWEKTLRLDSARPPEVVAQPYDIAAGLMMLTCIVVSVFYCPDALHAERRDRSILFWKSLPVSDLTTVLAKLSIPLIVLPLPTFAITVDMQWIMLLLNSVVLLGSTQSVAALWMKFSLFRMSMLLLYHLLTAHALMPNKRGNPNWGRPMQPASVLCTEFEMQVTLLRLTPAEYVASARLRSWCEKNKNQYYIPEWLLAEWDLHVIADISGAA